MKERKKNEKLVKLIKQNNLKRGRRILVTWEVHKYPSQTPKQA